MNHSPSARPVADATDRSAWHRRLSRPVLGWMVALIILVIVHRWVPQSRWLLVHMVTLGLLTTSVMIWGQHFADSLLKTASPPRLRARQVRRIHLLTAGIVVSAIGMAGAWPLVTLPGAAMVAAAVCWFAGGLVLQLRAALPARFRSTVHAYAVAAAMVILGAGFGAALAFSLPEPWQGRLLLAHLITNLLGFIGTTVLATLVTLGPTILRTRLPDHLEILGRRLVAVLPAAVALATIGALTGLRLLTLAGVAVFLAVAVAEVTMLAGAARRVILQRRSRARERAEDGRGPAETLPLFPPLSIGSGLVWFLVTLGATAVLLVRGGSGPDGALLAGDLQLLTLPFVAGFGLQVLLGAMSFLMPTVMGGGPRAVRAALTALSRGAVARVVLVNGSLIAFLLVDGSWTRVLLSLLGVATLVAFVPLMVQGVRVNLRERRPPLEAAQPAEKDVVPSAPDTTRAVPGPIPSVGRRAAGAALGVAGVLTALAVGRVVDGRPLLGIGSGGPAADEVTPTGRTVHLEVTMHEMHFAPDSVRLNAGDRLVVDLHNADPTTEHDLMLENGTSSGRIAPGEDGTLDAGVIATSLEGWCTIVGHRAMGMVFDVEVMGSPTAGTAEHSEHAEPAAERIDLEQPPGADHARRDPALPPPAGSDPVPFLVTEPTVEVAPGRRIQAMTYEGHVMGPILHTPGGEDLTIQLRNEGTMGHSLDLHAGTVSPDEAMRTIAPGEELTYAITAEHAGAWLYHCSTMPMTVHLASGMYGALIVPPEGLDPVDHEWVVVQSEGYLGPDGEPIDVDKLQAEQPDVILWNGHANQYVHEPLRASAGDRLRIWVVDAGPNRAMSFHVVGGVFDTVFKEGAYLLRPGNAEGGGSQSLDLAPAQGGFVELTIAEPGTYTAVSHTFVDMERGARALIVVT
ncbi:MAG: multicopper oxidase domain-containing protein [Brachybacterium sp.]|nr:multicopper oxidase domain-containing protein [Brachybacterium sp.]